MNRRDYINRTNKVMNYIENHLEADLSLAALSRIAAFSPFHFHRMFKAIVGVWLMSETGTGSVKGSIARRSSKPLTQPRRG